MAKSAPLWAYYLFAAKMYAGTLGWLSLLYAYWLFIRDRLESAKKILWIGCALGVACAVTIPPPLLTVPPITASIALFIISYIRKTEMEAVAQQAP
jgi:hypothetical protein